jgi:hypothetical protein
MKRGVTTEPAEISQDTEEEKNEENRAFRHFFPSVFSYALALGGAMRALDKSPVMMNNSLPSGGV